MSGLNFIRDLNPEQIEAIEEPDSVFLVACPGSGKTRTLTYKIAKELATLDEKNKWVVAITYTHSAADEIKERIESLGVDTERLWIGTIHAFCNEWILKPYSGYLENIKYGYKVINSHESEELLSVLCKKYNYPSITHYDCGYYYTTNGIKYSCSATKQYNVRQVLDEYHTELGNNHQIDFEQILYFSHQLLLKCPSISKILSNLFTHVLVDEYQDTKEIQYAIFSRILSAGNGSVKIFIVGDPNQAIYTSLGGYAISIDELRSLTNLTIEPKALTKNYRSSSRIIEFFSHYTVNPALITPEGDDQDYPSRIYYLQNNDLAILAEDIGEKVEFFVKQCGIDQNEICIVAPWWVHLASMTRRLTTIMPEYKFNGPGLTPFSRDVDNFWYKVAKLILTEPSPKIFIRRARWAKEIIDDLHAASISTDITYKDILRRINEIKAYLVELDGLKYLHKSFDILFSRLAIDYSLYPALFEHHEAFFESSERRIKKITNENATYDGSIDTFRKVFMPKSGITVSTIHGVKGTEFDAVIGYGLLDGFVPHFSDSSTESAKKLLYVLSSRAKKHLCLISENNRIDRYTKQPRPATHILAAHNFDYDQVEQETVA